MTYLKYFIFLACKSIPECNGALIVCTRQHVFMVCTPCDAADLRITRHFTDWVVYIYSIFNHSPVLKYLQYKNVSNPFPTSRRFQLQTSFENTELGEIVWRKIRADRQVSTIANPKYCVLCELTRKMLQQNLLLLFSATDNYGILTPANSLVRMLLCKIWSSRCII